MRRKSKKIPIESILWECRALNYTYELWLCWVQCNSQYSSQCTYVLNLLHCLTYLLAFLFRVGFSLKLLCYRQGSSSKLKIEFHKAIDRFICPVPITNYSWSRQSALIRLIAPVLNYSFIIIFAQMSPDQHPEKICYNFTTLLKRGNKLTISEQCYMALDSS